VPPKKHIIIIGVLCVISLGLGYWYGGLERSEKFIYKQYVSLIIGGAWVACTLLILLNPIKTIRYPKLLSIGLGYMATWIFLLLHVSSLESSEPAAIGTVLRFCLNWKMVWITGWAFGFLYLVFMVGRLIYFVGEKLISNIRKHLGSSKTKCKWCKEIIKADALICKHCGTMLKDDETVS